jgi:hypothetical protein
MPAPLKLNWIDKVNSPELLAYLQQYGTQTYLSAEEINELRDVINEWFANGGSGGASTPPTFGEFEWIMRGTAHTGSTPIAGDVFRGIISAIGQPLEISESLIWNGTGALNQSNLINFEIRNST